MAKPTHAQENLRVPPGIVRLQQPRTLVFGPGCLANAAADLTATSFGRFVIITGPSGRRLCEPLCRALSDAGRAVEVFDAVSTEPTVALFESALCAARDFRADAVVGFGGGSPMDVAKLVAALLQSTQSIRDVFGIGKLARRGVFSVCIPTTAGTGSEVSPNAILLDETELLKKGVISPHLVPDAAYLDPQLTFDVPPAITAATGMDALTHCIETYANKFAHPVIDHLALEGVRLISTNLARAVDNGHDAEARTALALGSMYGGMCLGPVNTGAVHALAYPLGGEFHVAHGVSNAVLLPHLLEFNLPAAPNRYAAIARAMGAPQMDDDAATARASIDLLRKLSTRCGIPAGLSQLNIPAEAIDRIARSAITVTRLLERNVREVQLNDAIEIYRRAM